MIINPIVIGSGKYNIRKYGITVNNVLHNPTSSGSYEFETSIPFNFDGTGIKAIKLDRAFYRKFQETNAEGSILSFPDLEVIEGESVFNYACYKAKLSSISAPKLKKVKGTYIFYYAFNGFGGTGRLRELVFPKLEYMHGSNIINNAFFNQSSLRIVFVPKLLTMQDCSLVFGGGHRFEMFNVNGCIYCDMPTIMFSKSSLSPEALTELRFPMMQSFKASTTTNSFDCSGLQLHFRTDVENTVKALAGYATGFGTGSSDNVHFDLISEIKFDGNTYQRDEYYSKYDSTYAETRIAWNIATITVGGKVYTRDYKKDAQGNDYVTTKTISPNYAVAWTNGTETIYTDLDDGYQPVVGSMSHTDIQHRYNKGAVTASTNSIIFTRAGADPDVGDYVYDEDDFALGTITEVH